MNDLMQADKRIDKTLREQHECFGEKRGMLLRNYRDRERERKKRIMIFVFEGLMTMIAGFSAVPE